ncbi:class I SAM-dependent methyltransferase [Chitinimonas sp. BJB300]|uniref:class I SAM-dependent methyltransferase n=1 Tax=Chitinimonas sp. BJB300 TaxID=1559339 RepID=UPI000C0E67FF|nr:class I SAM-dependent methyltransferase [Chitinimonas sp. BJB300]PHV12208.1 SAM-dependent methyltransferase [Chitinimonas sp. BJB300]TSJ91613.1 SAM-dependent methyltransferase [Chitinimonas sp. BJB300]
MSALQDFQNRLAKNAKHYAKWAKRVGTEAYRIYDRDIPQYPVAVDVYGGRAHIAEYDTGWQQTDEEHAAWAAEVRATVADVLGMPPKTIAFKIRRRQKGEFQYSRTGHHSEDFVVLEQGCKFWVNLDEYLDTGLFLDHRPTRKKVAEEADGKRFLNLFAYTGSFTVYAATGGATSSVTVDLSNTYLDWSKRNLELNGVDLQRHQLVRADVFRYLETAIDEGQLFDLIVLDPPSFSNSAKMLDILDVQRDHVLLVQSCLKLLMPGGVLYFSNNFRGFELDYSLKALCRDISAQSVPEDFRNRKIHHCFRFQV